MVRKHVNQQHSFLAIIAVGSKREEDPLSLRSGQKNIEEKRKIGTKISEKEEISKSPPSKTYPQKPERYPTLTYTHTHSLSSYKQYL